MTVLESVRSSRRLPIRQGRKTGRCRLVRLLRFTSVYMLAQSIRVLPIVVLGLRATYIPVLRASRALVRVMTVGLGAQFLGEVTRIPTFVTV